MSAESLSGDRLSQTLEHALQVIVLVLVIMSLHRQTERRFNERAEVQHALVVGMAQSQAHNAEQAERLNLIQIRLDMIEAELKNRLRRMVKLEKQIKE